MIRLRVGTAQFLHDAQLMINTHGFGFVVVSMSCLGLASSAECSSCLGAETSAAMHALIARTPCLSLAGPTSMHQLHQVHLSSVFSQIIVAATRDSTFKLTAVQLRVFVCSSAGMLAAFVCAAY
jgi:hypothetical protein